MDGENIYKIADTLYTLFFIYKCTSSLKKNKHFFCLHRFLFHYKEWKTVWIDSLNLTPPWLQPPTVEYIQGEVLSASQTILLLQRSLLLHTTAQGHNHNVRRLPWRLPTVAADQQKTSTDTITLCSQHVAMIAAQTMNYFQCLAFLFLPAGSFIEMLAIDSASSQTIWLYPCPQPIPFSFLLKPWYQLPCCEFIAQQVWIHSTWMVNRKLKKIRENNLFASR